MEIASKDGREAHGVETQRKSAAPHHEVPVLVNLFIHAGRPIGSGRCRGGINHIAGASLLVEAFGQPATTG
jgi:hypothetical protein